jgi:Putative transposase of IS4/5 family (DUF4096)
MWTDVDRSRYRQSWGVSAERSERCGMGSLGASDSAGEAGGRPRQTDMRLAMNAIFYLLRTGCPWRYLPHGGLPAALDGLQHLPRFPAGGSMGGDLGGTARGAARTAGAGGEPQRRRHRQPVAQVGRKRGCAKDEADTVGYDAGKKVKGRKIHALVDTEGLPLRVVGSARNLVRGAGFSIRF